MTISIITVVFNSINNIKDTIESVKNQTYKGIEHVVIDGNSNDGTKEYLIESEVLFSYFTTEPDKGLYYAMNKGIDAAEGDFVLFMNSGDTFVDTMVIERCAYAISELDKLYFGNTIVFYDKMSSKAPKLHHQSILFPKKFYSKNYYKADIFKVSAEGDYIHRATQALATKHVNIDMIYSKLEGFRVTRYKTLKGMKLMLKEYIQFHKENKLVIKPVPLLNYLSTSLVKYSFFKIGGISLVAKVLLKSYKS